MTKADILERVKRRGERVTLPRLAVIEALCALNSHQTAQSIQQHLAGQQIDLEESTVYRVLQWLKDLGIVAQTDLGQSGITYEVVSTPPHHHLVCLVCGQIQDVDDSVLEPLRRHLRADYAFEPRIDHMAFFGICCRCRSAGSVDREDAESLPPR
ncbi:MAG: transcriptional repressor [Chloroflexi bacterium]|nr:transcriptional repressor [Chloroflexota bacterium]